MHAKQVVWEKIEDKDSILFLDKDSPSIVIIVKNEIYNSLYIFTKDDEEKYFLKDISLIEQQNIGQLFLKRKGDKYEKVKTIVTNWESSEYQMMITFCTKVVKDGVTYSVRQPLIIKKNGKIAWR